MMLLSRCLRRGGTVKLVAKLAALAMPAAALLVGEN